MNMKIISDEKNPLLKRRDVVLSVDFTEKKTPSRDDLRKEAVKLVKAKEELVILDKVISEYGTQIAKIEVLVYDDEASMKAIEEKYIIKKHTPKEEKKEGEASAAPTEEKPAESENKTEAPKEEKKEEAQSSEAAGVEPEAPTPAKEKSTEEKPAEEKPAEKAE